MPPISKFDEERMRFARKLAERNLLEMTDEEDRAITADAMRDPDNPPIEDDDLGRFMTWKEYLARYHGKTTVTLDLDLVERFRKSGDDWEDRINAILLAAAPAE